ncbi:glycosyltransferase [Pseudothermotoga sp.]|uniref:glycosyltransferase n=1 Tax=Pseudothermotoga sp. TaxID=2033661 RepID=UPI0031F7109E
MRSKILQIITRSDWAGGQKVLYSIAYGIKKYYPEQFDVEVACGKENGMLIPELEKIGVKVHIIDDLVREISLVKDFKAFLQIRRLIKQNKYDVVHLHSSKAGFLGRIAARLCKVKNIIYTVHGWWPIEQYHGLKRKLFIFAERFAAKFCDKIVFLCKRDMEKAKTWKIGKESQYVVIPNAIVPIENVQKGKLRKELNLSEDIKIIGNVARLDRQKNPLRFLEIAELVLKERKDVAFVWIGSSIVEGDCGKKVEEWLKQHPQEAKHIHLLPFRKDAIELMADFDVFLLTSDAEGMPLVVLEAQSLGIPVVSTDVGCVGEMAGKIMVASSSNMLCKYILELLGSEHRNEEHRVSFGYFENFVESHVRIYQGV